MDVGARRPARPVPTGQKVRALRYHTSRTAMRIFGEDGDASATVERIATEAGISARTFHRYFPAKEDVVRPVFERSAELTAAALRAAPRDRDPVDVLVDAMLALVHRQRMTPEHQAFLRLVSDLPEFRLRWQEAGHGTRDVVREFLAGRIPDPDPQLQDLPAALVVQTTHHVLDLWLRGAPPEELEALLRRGLRTVFDGVRLHPEAGANDPGRCGQQRRAR